MDNAVYNGYKCGLCSRRLASKYTLERHIRLKHKPDLDHTLENDPPAKKTRVADGEKLNNSDGPSIAKYEYFKKEGESDDSGKESNNSDPDTDLDNNNHMDSGKAVYTNKAGWVESDNKEVIGNSNNNTESEESSADSEEIDMQCTKELVYNHKLFDVIETCKDVCDKFGNCGNLATFRIHRAPVGIGCANKYIEWMRELFTGILDYFSQKYTPDAEDYISFGMLHADHPDKGMWLWMRKYKDLDVKRLISVFCDAQIQPTGDLTIWYKHEKLKEGCQTCGRL